MSTIVTTCASCGFPVQPLASFCGNCGAKISIPSMSSPQQPPSYSPSSSVPQQPVSTGAYKAIIAGLLIVILILGIILASSAAHLLALGPYRYQLTTPTPSYQSTLPRPSPTTQTPVDTIWNACNGTPSAGCSMTATGWREGSVPDTFDYYVSFTSTVNVTVYFFTMGQFVQFSVCGGLLSCVAGYYDSIGPTTNPGQYWIFTLGEGCADYLAIYVASGNGIMHPNVGVTYNPAQSGATGYCSQTG